MMHNHQIQDAMNHLDPGLIQEASQPNAQKKTRLRPMVLAACLVLLVVIPVMAVTGSLLVEHYYGDSIPKNLEEQELDAFFRANTGEKVPAASFAPELQEGEPGVSHYGFDSLEAAEAFLGLELPELDLDHRGYPVPTTGPDGSLISNSPCNLTLLHNPDGLLYGMNLQYFFLNQKEEMIICSFHAVTDWNPNENNSSIGVSNEGADVVSQSSETYETASGARAAIVSTEYSGSHGWSVDGWMEQKGFVLRFSLSADDRETGVETLRELLDAVR